MGWAQALPCIAFAEDRWGRGSLFVKLLAAYAVLADADGFVEPITDAELGAAIGVSPRSIPVARGALVRSKFLYVDSFHRTVEPGTVRVDFPRYARRAA